MHKALHDKDNCLLSLNIENDNELCAFTEEYQDGFKAISILIDSGASDSVAPPETFPEINIFETTASRAGLQYTAAGGEKIRNQGMCRPVIQTTDGLTHSMAFQVAAVSKPLGAVSRIVGAGNRVVFDDKDGVGSYIQNRKTGKCTPLRQNNGVYYLDVWMKPGDGLDAKGNRVYTGFHRQGS